MERSKVIWTSSICLFLLLCGQIGLIAYNIRNVYLQTGFLCWPSEEIGRLQETVPVHACGKGVVVELQSVHDEDSRGFLSLKTFCELGCDQLRVENILNLHSSVLTDIQRDYVQDVMGIRTGPTTANGNRELATQTRQPFPSDQVILVDPIAKTVGGIDICVPTSELRKLLGDERVKDSQSELEIDSVEQITSIDFESARIVTIYRDRKMFTVSHTAFETKDGLHTGLFWRDFERTAACDASSWEGGEISRAICRDFLVGLSGAPSPNRVIEEIVVSCGN